MFLLFKLGPIRIKCDSALNNPTQILPQPGLKSKTLNKEQKKFLQSKSITQTTIGKILSAIIVCQDRTNTTSFLELQKGDALLLRFQKTSMKIMSLILNHRIN